MKEIKWCFKILSIIPDEEYKIRQTDNIVIPVDEDRMLEACTEIIANLKDVARRLICCVKNKPAADTAKALYHLAAKITDIIGDSISAGTGSNNDVWSYSNIYMLEALKKLCCSDEFKDISTLYNGGIQAQIDNGAKDWQTFNVFCFLSVDIFGEDDK